MGKAYAKADITLLAVFVLLLCLLSAASADVTVTKEVTGERTVDFGGRLHVRVSVASDVNIRIESVNDPVPSEFSAINQPQACAFLAGLLTCSFGFSATSVAVEYDLVAVGAGQKVVFLPARLTYKTADGLEESRASNEVEGVFYVGRALLNTSVSVLEVDGTPTLQASVLPNSKLRIGVSTRNSGALPAESVSLSLPLPAGWSVSSGKTSSSMDRLSSGDSQGIIATLSAPPVGSFAEGTIYLNYTASWVDAGKTISVPTPIAVFMTMARVEASRHVSVKWRKDGANLQAVLETVIDLSNKGSADATVTLDQSVPGTIEKTEIVPSLKLAGKESKSLRAVSLVQPGTLKMPAGAAGYTDAIGNRYPATAFEAEDVRVEESVWAIVYGMAQPYFPIPQIICAAIVLAVMLFFPNLLKKPYLLLALGALVLVSLLVLASTVIVWFGA